METPLIHKELLSGKAYVVEKKVGETPLECLERFREGLISSGSTDFAKIPMTYAGRLDPMASGKLIILCGDECKKKEAYLGLDKEYEVEIVLGIKTDTHDALGLAEVEPASVENRNTLEKIDFTKYAGKFLQEYPAYSSKTVGGVQLHELSRKNKLPDEIPVKNVEIYSITEIKKSEILAEDLLAGITEKINLVKGDFRQNEIKERWANVLSGTHKSFSIVKILVSCSSGTYMRSLASRIGREVGTEAFALSIHRTKVLY